MNTYANIPPQKASFGTHHISFPYNAAAYTPQLVRTAYKWQSSRGGEGVKIGIICAFDNEALQENTDTFCRQFSLPLTNINKVYTTDKRGSAPSNWTRESSLDCQWIHVFAPMAELVCVFAQNDEIQSLLDAAEYASSKLSCDIVCMCFGREEAADDKELSAFFQNKSCIFVSSSGDVGSKPSFPSTSPYCVSVGGTSLKINSKSGMRISEIAWENSGGGPGDIFEIPLWQARFFNIYAMSLGKRATPDVAMNASFSPGSLIYDGLTGGWQSVGGTSLAAACFTGICADIKAKNSNINNSEDMLTYLYALAGTNGYDKTQNFFYDITLGNSGKYSAMTGWDFCTGLGAPNISCIISGTDIK